MLKNKNQHTMAGTSNRRRHAQIVVLPSNIALVSPPVERLEPLRDYRAFFMPPGNFAADPLAADALQDPEFSPCSAFPAGLLGRFKAALRRDGYRVTVADRRSEGALWVNERMFKYADADADAFVRAVVAEPLGQVEFRHWPDLGWKIASVCRLFPKSRRLITGQAEDGLDEELSQRLGDGVGFLNRWGRRGNSQCVIAGPRWIPAARGVWEVAIPVVFGPSGLDKAFYEAVLNLGARRVYAMVSQHIKLSKFKQMRLEAMAGALIHPQPAS